MHVFCTCLHLPLGYTCHYCSHVHKQAVSAPPGWRLQRHFLLLQIMMSSPPTLETNVAPQGSSQKKIRGGGLKHICGFYDRIKEFLPQKGGALPSFPLWLDPCTCINVLLVITDTATRFHNRLSDSPPNHPTTPSLTILVVLQWYLIRYL